MSPATIKNSSMEEELPPSKLGTREHWDEVYEREVRNFEDTGDEGEVWFGESSVRKMRQWATKHLPPSSSSSNPIRILECGSGNGTLLLSFLTSPESSGKQSFHLTGIDYSESAVILSRNVEIARRESLEDDMGAEEVENDVEVEWKTGDLLKDKIEEQWDLVLEKGTYDALCLSDKKVDVDGEERLPSKVYPEKIAGLVKEGGFFLITSCNFTESEIKERYTRAGLGLVYHSSVPHPAYTFGGRSGTMVCTVAFQKVSPTTIQNGSANGVRMVNGAVSDATANGDREVKPNGASHGDLYICIDCGGTKTDVAIASENGIVARAIGGTGNMAEVGLQLSFEIICATVLDAIAHLPSQFQPSHAVNGVNGDAKDVCPVRFRDVWVGISGCDTPLDQKRMSDLLGPFFGREGVPILNDAHLLGGALLTHHCPWGVAVIAGTGSVVIALEVDKNGEVVQVGRRGGTGYLLGDDGSAFDLGRCAIRHAIDVFDAGEEVEGGLAGDIREHFGVQETGEVLAKVYDLDPSLSPSDATNERKLRISELSRPILDRFCESPPDQVAKSAVYQAAGLLVDSILSLVKQMEKQSSSSSTSSASAIGGTGGKRRKVSEAALMMGGGVIRQSAYRKVVVELLAKGGVEFGVEEVVKDVAGEGVMGLVEKAKEGRGTPGTRTPVKVNGEV